MQNTIQMGNSPTHNWHNADFKSLFGKITAKLPNSIFVAIVFSYLCNAALNCYAIDFPLYLTVPLSLAIQSLRFLTILTPFLNAHGRAGSLPEFIAICAAIVALAELSFSLQTFTHTTNGFWSLFLFGAALVCLSMILEIQFITAGKKAFGLTSQASGAVIEQQPPIPHPVDDVAALKAEIEFLRNQAKQQPAAIAIEGNGQASGTRRTTIPTELTQPSSNGNGQH